MTSGAQTQAQLVRRGDRGAAVVQLQLALNSAGFDAGQADGIFGARTEAAVRALQMAHGLGVDGIAGPRTWAALNGAADVDVSVDVEAPADVDAPTDVQAPADVDAPAPAATTDWPTVGGDERMRYVMRRLVEHYQYPVNGAAGLVGNLWAESGVIPQRVEGSRPDTPMRAKDFDGNVVDFSAEQVMNRDKSARQGPARPGVGLAQWTSAGRRSGLFTHSYNGGPLGADVLFDMDAEIDYLDHELRTSYARVHQILTAADVSVDDACDEILYSFEIPGAILSNGSKLPRGDARVQEVFRHRREPAARALRAYETAVQ